MGRIVRRGVLVVVAAALATGTLSVATTAEACACGAFSIGNRVWLDDSASPAQWGSGGGRNDGSIDGADDGDLVTGGVQDPGIEGVALELYRDVDGGGTIDPGDSFIGTQVTDSTGHYLFDGVGAGTYLVRIPASEFAAGEPLAGLVSSATT